MRKRLQRVHIVNRALYLSRIKAYTRFKTRLLLICWHTFWFSYFSFSLMLLLSHTILTLLSFTQYNLLHHLLVRFRLTFSFSVREAACCRAVVTMVIRFWRIRPTLECYSFTPLPLLCFWHLATFVCTTTNSTPATWCIIGLWLLSLPLLRACR